MSDKAIINQSIESLMDDINKLKEQGYYSIYIPSLKKSVSFAPLEIKHQKDILVAWSDPEFGQFKFINTLNQVIIDCLVDKATPLLVTDRPLITLAIRAQCVSGTYDYIDDNGLNQSINLDEHLKDRKKLKLLTREKKFNISSGKVKLVCSVPTLMQDKKFNVYIYNQRPTALPNSEPPGAGDIFIGELAKYIDSIQINEQIIDCRSLLTPGQVVSLLERLPMSLTYKLTERLQPVRDIELASVQTTDLGIIPIDARLFT